MDSVLVGPRSEPAGLTRVPSPPAAITALVLIGWFIGVLLEPGVQGLAWRMHTRVTGIVIQDGRLLVLDQDTDGPRRWSLPEGKVENGETLQEALVREIR